MTRMLFHCFYCSVILHNIRQEKWYYHYPLSSFQEAYRRSNSWLPPPWAIVAIAVLGFNEFMALLRYTCCSKFLLKI